MDLIEIRKKAKEKKEAEERAALEAARAKAQEQAPGPEEAEPARPAPVKKKRKRKKSSPAPAAKPSQAEATPAPEDEDMDVSFLIGADEEPETELAGAPEAAEEVRPVEPAEETGVKVGPTVTEAPKAEAAGVVTQSEPEKPEVFDEEAESSEEEAAEDRIVEYLAFMLADEEYAVKVEDVKEIIRLQRITMVPRAESFVEGIISLRGVIIPVFDIKRRLGFEITDKQRTTRILIVSEDDNPQGMIVDRVTGVVRLREGAIEPPPAVIGGVEGEYLEGVGRIGDRLVILFNTGKVLSMDSGVSG